MTDYLSFRADLARPEMVAGYDELPLWSSMFGLLLLRHVPLRPGIAALDVGCGTGFPVIELAERLGPGSRVVGLDPWEAALERARFKVREWGVPNVELLKGDAADMPLPDGAFDLVVSNLGLNNFARPDAALAECRRVTKREATLVLTTNLQGHMAELYEAFVAVLTELGRPDAVRALEEHVRGRATVASVRALLDRAGFQVEKVQEAKEVLRFASASALFRQHFVKLAFLGAWKEIAAGDREEVFRRLEARLAGELALTIPMAYVEARKR